MSNDSPNRRIFLQKIVTLSTAFAIPSFAKTKSKGRIAIVYYSHTQIFAMYLQGRLGADLYRIHTEQDYPSDYQVMVKQAALEQKKNYKPKLKEDLMFLNSYDIYL